MADMRNELNANDPRLLEGIRSGDIDPDRTIGGIPILALAISKDRLEVAQALIERGADVNAYARRPAAEQGMAPVHFVRSPEAVALLARAGANIDAPYKDVDHAWGMRGETALHTAALGNDMKRVAVAQALIEAGADPTRPYGPEYKYSRSSTAIRSERVVREGSTITSRLDSTIERNAQELPATPVEAQRTPPVLEASPAAVKQGADRQEYRLSEEENERIFQRDVKPYLMSIATPGLRSSDEPTMVIVGGQPGAGKSRSIDSVKLDLEKHGGVIEIAADDLRKFHPRNEELMRKDDRTAADFTHADASAWAEKAERYAREQRFNVLLEGTLKTPENAAAKLSEYRDAGYFVEARVIAVHERASWQGVVSRYETQKERDGAGRMTPRSVHDAAVSGVLETVEKIETEKLADRVRIDRRGAELLYSNTLQADGNWERTPAARETMQAERDRPLSVKQWDTHIAGYDEIEKLQSRPGRDAQAEEIESIRQMRAAAVEDRERTAEREAAAVPREAGKTPAEQVNARRVRDDDRDMRGPAVGIIQIDGKPATSVRFERGEVDGSPAYTVAFMMDGKTVARLKNLDDIGLDEAVGDKNARAIREGEAEKGTLKGSTLTTEYGLSPEESARRSAEKEDRKQAEMDRLQSQGQSEATIVAPRVDGPAPMAEPGPNARAGAGNDQPEQEPDGPDERNVVSQDTDRIRLPQVDVPEAMARIEKIRELQRLEREGSAQAKPDPQRDGKPTAPEGAPGAAPAANQSAARPGPEPIPLTADERDRARQLELMDQVHTQFRVSGSKFHFKDQPQRIAFKDKGSRMVSASNDERVAHAMATMAEAKGWTTIRVSGHPDFQREVWLEGSLRGIEVRGFKPQQKDLDELDTRLDKRSRNSVAYEADKIRQDGQKARQEPSAASDRGQPAPQAQAAARNGKPAATPQATRNEPVRGRAAQGLDYSSLQDPPKHYQPSERARVAAAVAEAVTDRIKNPKQREAVLAAIATRLEALDKQGKVPGVQVYDKAAPSQHQQPDQTRPQVERNSERTR